MNNAKLWLVVSPTVGVPIFLGAVAVSSFAVHYQVVKNTSWITGYYQGNPINGEEQATLLNSSDMDTAKVAYTTPVADGMEVTVVLPDGTTTQAILQMPETKVSYDTGAASTTY